MDKGPARFVDSQKGDDGNDGSESKPWKTLAYAAATLQPGETAYLRTGIYHEHVTVTVSGKTMKPVTIRSYPGELAIVDGGIREFFENPAGAWEPCPNGVKGEFWSKKTFPEFGRGRSDVSSVFGRFGDSLLPLQAYRFRTDLQSTNEFWTVGGVKGGKTSDENGQGIYCGPGVWYDMETGRIHCRLAHTKLEGLGDDNYRGETDPRKLPLVIAGYAAGPAFSIENARNVRVQDLVFRGAGTATVRVTNSVDVELDGVASYGGYSAMLVSNTRTFRLFNSVLRGLGAPWIFRGSLKYRAVEGQLFAASGWNSWGNRDFELAYNEFTDSVDGVFIGNVAGVKFHHNVLDNVTDDGIFLTATTTYDGKTPGGNTFIWQNYISRCLTAFAFGAGHGRQRTIEDGPPGAWGKRQTGAGVWIYRNVFDFRRPVNYQIPQNAEEAKTLNFVGRMAGDHGSPLWEPMSIYHNTILAGSDAWRNYYAATLGANGMGGGTKRLIFNNIIRHIQGKPGFVLPEKPAELQADGNLSWSDTDGTALQPEFLTKLHSSRSFAASKTNYPPGCGARDLFADPKFVRYSVNWRDNLDLSLQKESPAIDSGIVIPKELPDPIRVSDKGVPDVGAVPYGVEPWRVGVRGRFSAFGERLEPSLPFDAAALNRGSHAVRSAVPQDAPTNKPTLIVRGYPAPDADYLLFALNQQRVPVHESKTWVPPADYGKYKLVTIVGSLARAKVEPNQFSAKDLEAVKAYMEQGGTLCVMMGGLEPFAHSEGLQFLFKLLGTSRSAWDSLRKIDDSQAKMTILKPQDPWIKTLKAGASHPWITADKTVNTIHSSLGEPIIGTSSGHTILYRLRVGKGQFLYIGWDINRSIPGGRTPSTIDQERVFEEQIQVLNNIVSDVY